MLRLKPPVGDLRGEPSLVQRLGDPCGRGFDWLGFASCDKRDGAIFTGTLIGIVPCRRQSERTLRRELQRSLRRAACPEQRKKHSIDAGSRHLILHTV